MPYFPPAPGGSVILPNSIDNSALADMIAARIKGQALGAGFGDPTDLTGAQVAAILNADPAPGAYPLLATLTAAGSTSLDFIGDSTKYASYICEVSRLIPSVAGAPLVVRGSNDGGATWQASNYLWGAVYHEFAGATPTGGYTGGAGVATFIAISTTLDNAAGNLSGIIRVIPSSVPGQTWTSVHYTETQYSNPGYYQQHGGGIHGLTFHSIRFMPNSGLLSSGVIRVWGVPK